MNIFGFHYQAYMVVKGQDKAEESLNMAKANASKLHSRTKNSSHYQFSSVTSSMVGAHDADVQVRLKIHLLFLCYTKIEKSLLNQDSIFYDDRKKYRAY